jgi:hypothetical protein
VTDESHDEVLADRMEQRRAALKKANEVRRQNALVKRLLRERKLDPFDLIAGNIGDPDLADELEGVISEWTLERLLLAVPGIGRARKQEILSVFRTSPLAKVKTLNYERRDQLAKLARAAREIAV